MSAMISSDETAFSGLLHAGTGGRFMRVPYVPPETDTLKANNITAAFVGFPWDSMCISRTGTNYGPRAIREASDQFTFFNANRNVDLKRSYGFADCGDIPVIPGSAVATMARAEAILSSILSAGAMPITVGGDHSITIAGVRAFRKTYRNPGLILVDSHLDTADDVGGERLTMPVRSPGLSIAGSTRPKSSSSAIMVGSTHEANTSTRARKASTYCRSRPSSSRDRSRSVARQRPSLVIGQIASTSLSTLMRLTARMLPELACRLPAA